jgi:hypothetical protein
MEDNKIKIKLFVGESVCSSPSNIYLPEGSQAMTQFKAPLEIFVRNAENLGEDMSEVIPVFCEIWPEVLKVLADLSEKGVLLIYFAGLATDFDLITVIPFLPVSDDDNERFFISEVCKDSTTRIPVQMRLCVEYSYKNFKRMVGPNGFQYFSGTTIMGLVTTNKMVRKLLRANVRNKNLLAEFINKEDVFCWWICGDDLDRLVIRHKSYSGLELAQLLQEKIFKKFRYPTEICTE